MENSAKVKSCHQRTSGFGAFWSGDSWIYPYQRTPMGNPYISPISRGYLWIKIPKNPKVEHQLNTMVAHVG